MVLAVRFAEVTAEEATAVHAMSAGAVFSKVGHRYRILKGVTDFTWARSWGRLYVTREVYDAYMPQLKALGVNDVDREDAGFKLMPMQPPDLSELYNLNYDVLGRAEEAAAAELELLWPPWRKH